MMKYQGVDFSISENTTTKDTLTKLLKKKPYPKGIYGEVALLILVGILIAYQLVCQGIETGVWPLTSTMLY